MFSHKQWVAFAFTPSEVHQQLVSTRVVHGG
jgi:hypothetical protein